MIEVGNTVRVVRGPQASYWHGRTGCVSGISRGQNPVTYQVIIPEGDGNIELSFYLEDLEVIISDSPELVAKSNRAIRRVLSNMSTLLTTLAQRIEIVEWRQSGQAEQMAAMIARRSEADKRIAELTSRVETLTAVVEDMAGFDADEQGDEPAPYTYIPSTAGEPCHICGDTACHFNTLTCGHFCHECFGLILQAGKVARGEAVKP